MINNKSAQATDSSFKKPVIAHDDFKSALFLIIQNPFALDHIDSHHIAYKGLVLIALMINGEALQCVDQSIEEYPSIARQVVTSDPNVLSTIYYTCSCYQASKSMKTINCKTFYNITIGAIKKDPSCISLILPKITEGYNEGRLIRKDCNNNNRLAKMAIDINPSTMQFLYPHSPSYIKLAHTAISKDRTTLQHLKWKKHHFSEEEYRKNLEITKFWLEVDPDLIQYIGSITNKPVRQQGRKTQHEKENEAIDRKSSCIIA